MGARNEKKTHCNIEMQSVVTPGCLCTYMATHDQIGRFGSPAPETVDIFLIIMINKNSCYSYRNQNDSL